MDWIKFPLVQLTLSYTFGIAVANWLEVATNLIGIAGIGLFLIALGIHIWAKKTTRKPVVFNLCIAGVFMLLGIYNFGQHLPILPAKTNINRQQGNQFYVQEVLKETDFSARYYGIQPISNNKLLIRIKKDSSCSPLQLGRYYLTNSASQLIPTPKNPYEFNYSAYLYWQGIRSQIKVSANQIVALETVQTSLRIKAGEFRQRLQQKLNIAIKTQII